MWYSIFPPPKTSCFLNIPQEWKYCRPLASVRWGEIFFFFDLIFVSNCCSWWIKVAELFFSDVVSSYTYKNVSLILTIHFWMRQKVNYHLHLPYALTLFVSLLASVLSSHSLHLSAASVLFSQFSLSASVFPAPRWRPLMLTPRWRRARPPGTRSPLDLSGPPDTGQDLLAMQTGRRQFR